MQDTKELTTPNGHKVLVRGYVTGLIDQEVRKIELSANKTHYEVDANPDDIKNAQSGAVPEPENVRVVVESDPTVQIDADKKLLELMVLSVDGSNGDLLNALLNLPAADVKYVTDQVKALRTEGEVTAGDPKAPSN